MKHSLVAPGRRVFFSSSASPLATALAKTSAPKKRNPVLAEVIREGLPVLQETAAAIQASHHTRQPIFTQNNDDGEGDIKPIYDRNRSGDDFRESPKYKYTAHHVGEAAFECLNELALNIDDHDRTTSNSSSIGNWTLHSEPMQIVGVHLSSSLQHAVVHWSLPVSIMDDVVRKAAVKPRSSTSEENESFSSNGMNQQHERSIDHILQLQDILQRHYDEELLVRRMRARLRQHNRWNWIPAIRFEPASAELLLELLTVAGTRHASSSP